MSKLEETPQKRGRGRPKGVKNKRKYVSAIESLDQLTPKAVEKLESILDLKISGTTPAQVLAAAKLVLELASKEYERELSQLEDEDAPTGKDKGDDDETIVSLVAVR